MSEKIADPFIFQEYFDNGLNITHTVRFTRTENVANEYSWTFSQTIYDAKETLVNVNIPKICKIHDQYNSTIRTTTTDAQIKMNKKEWSVEQGNNTPCFLSLNFHRYYHSTQNYSQNPSSGQNGNVRRKFYRKYALRWIWNVSKKLHFFFFFLTTFRIWCHKKENGHNLWFLPPDNFLNFEGCSTLPDGQVCEIRGVFSGKQGVSVNVQVVECPKLRERC